jgi:hypothetical protein
LRIVALAAALTALASAQNFTQRGFLDLTGIGYPQVTQNDSGQFVGEGLFRYEAFYKLGTDFRFSGGIDARADTHQQTESGFHFSFRDREERRPDFAVRRLSAGYSHGKLTLEVGKQLISWGKVDFVRPTDRFAPQDQINFVTPDSLAVTAARATYGTQGDNIDVIYAPWLTPNRDPLINQRWSPLQGGVPVQELPPSIPGGAQLGVRWNHIRDNEYSLSYYQGHDFLPLFSVTPDPLHGGIFVQRFYPQLRMLGADAAAPFHWATFKGEAAYFKSSDVRSDQYLLYVLQLERQSGDWDFTGGYVGEIVTVQRDVPMFSPLRGLARAFVGKVSYTIDTNRSVSFEAAVRQNGQGVRLKPEYTQAFGQHWRATLGMAWISGSPSDFIGQYHQNRYVTLSLRYSF